MPIGEVLRARGGRGFLSEPLEPRVLMSVSLVKDLATMPLGTFDDDTQPLVPFGTSAYFDIGTALWKSNGTALGTSVVKDFAPLSPSTATVVGSSLLFTVDDGAGDFDLWKSNGTAVGTTRITSLPSADPYVGYENFTAVGGTLFFTRRLDQNATPGGYELWRSDGTAAGTFVLGDFVRPTYQEFEDLGFAALNGKLLFANTDATHGPELWVSDGTVSGTKLLDDINPGTNGSGPRELTTAGAELYFDAAGTDGVGLWKTDGTAGGTKEVALTGSFTQLTAVGSQVYFLSSTGLMRSDGTASGTISLGSLPADPVTHPVVPAIADVNGIAFIFANNYHDLWKSNGTAAGTVMLKSFPQPLSEPTNLNGTFVFAADDGTHGQELWKSDGTAAGTVLVSDIYPGATGSDPSQLTVVSGKLLFKATDPVAGRELWTSDGTATGTKLVGDLTAGTEDFDLHDTLRVGNLLYFTGRPLGTNDDALYRTDGTAAGTVRLVSGLASALTDADGTLYFSLNSVPSGNAALWKSDGTVAGTTMVAATTVDEMVAVGGTALSTTQGKLWKSDGTPTGTVVVPTSGPVIDLAAGPDGPVYYSTGILSGISAIGPYTLWAANATAANPVALGTFSGTLDQLLAVGSRLYFEGDDGTNAGLWTSDGTPSGTVFLSSVPPLFQVGSAPQTAVLNGRLLYFANAGAADTFLWSTDGTPAGTGPVADITAGGDRLAPEELVVAGNIAYFLGGDPFTGALSLWRTDGTARLSSPQAAAGTSLLIPDIGTTLTGDTPTLAEFDGNLYFPANLDPSIGPELFVADTGGIAPVADILPGPDGSYPDKLVSIGTALLFTADDGVHGRELWNFSLPADSISGRVYNDANHNAFQDAGEKGIANVTVFLDTNHDGQLETGEPTTKTDAGGAYSFKGLAPGSYAVRVVDPLGYRRTAPLLVSALATAGTSPQPTGPVFGEVAVASVPLDFGYLLALAQHYNAPGTFAQGDLNGDDKVDFADLLILAQRYGRLLPAAQTYHVPSARR